MPFQIGGLIGGVSTGGNTDGTTGTVGGQIVFVGSDNITLSQSVSGQYATISISGGGGGTGGATFKAGVSNVGNTSGQTKTVSNQLVLAGGNAITVSQGTAAGGATVTISGNSPFVAGISNVGNTGGDSGVSSTRLVLVGSNNLTASQTTGANGVTVGFNANPPFVAGVSNVGNTGGNTGVSSTQMVLVGSNNITLSQTTGANGVTVGINAAAAGGGGTLSFFSPNMWGSSVSAIQLGNGTLQMMPLNLPAALAASRLQMLGSCAASTNGTQSWAAVISFWAGMYSRNASTFSLATSGSTNYQFSDLSGGSFSAITGVRVFTVPISVSASAGDWWLGVVSVTSTTNVNSFAASNLGLTNQNIAIQGPFLSAADASVQVFPGWGIFSVTTAGMPNAIGITDIRESASGQRQVPLVVLLNYNIS